MAYKRLLMQKESAGTYAGVMWDGSDLTISTEVRDTDEWSVRVSDIPFQPVGELKDLPSNDWKGESGLEEYVPAVPAVKQYDMEVTFVYKSQWGTAAEDIHDVMMWLMYGGYFSIYCEWSGVGRQKVRYLGYSDDVESFPCDEEKTGASAYDVVTFKVKLRVDDPVTHIVLTK